MHLGCAKTAVLLSVFLLPINAFASVQEVVTHEAIKIGIPAGLALAFASVESGFNPNAQNSTSGKGTCRGIFQLLDETAKRVCGLTVEQLHQVVPNVRCGLKYLKSKIDEYEKLDWAIAAYNSGAPVLCASKKQVLKYKCKLGGLINQEYVDKIKLEMKKYE